MTSSGNARRENAETDRPVKRRPHRLQRNRCPPSWVVPSLVTTSELQRGQGIDAASWHQTTHPTPLQENREMVIVCEGSQGGSRKRRVDASREFEEQHAIRRPCGVSR